jgi:MFS family permease
MLPFWPAAVLNGVAGVFNILFFVPTLTLVQERAPRAVRARVMSSRAVLMSIALVVSYASATALASAFEPRSVMLVAGLLLSVGAAAASFVPVLRQR